MAVEQRHRHLGEGPDRKAPRHAKAYAVEQRDADHWMFASKIQNSATLLKASSISRRLVKGTGAMELTGRDSLFTHRSQRALARYVPA